MRRQSGRGNEGALPSILVAALAVVLVGLMTRGLAAPLVLVLLVVGLTLLVGRGRSRPVHAPRSPEDELRVRYALGEITRSQYQDGMVEILKEHYARGIIDLEQFETRVARLFSTKSPPRAGDNP